MYVLGNHMLNKQSTYEAIHGDSGSRNSEITLPKVQVIAVWLVMLPVIILILTISKKGLVYFTFS